MDNWDEIRTAYQVARLGTVSGAASALGVHHATVIRHIDALEARLGVKLFQRHARGYTATEAGTDLLRVAETTNEQFQQLEGRIRGRGSDVSGELVVTTLLSLAPIVMEPLISFQRLHPNLVVRLLTDDRLFRLEYGEAHVALRAGNAPAEPDNVVQPFAKHKISLYASRAYVERKGKPETLDDLKTHDFISYEIDKSRAPFLRWLSEHVPAERIIFRCTDFRLMREAMEAGLGICFLAEHEAAGRDDVVRVMETLEDWESPLWLVTHVDLHRTAKVQAFLQHLKAHAGVDT
ncbi:MAG: LysR family transcriptional regulator [Pelagimonas sp.]|jgi:DNA-binding transcriptional LysR family regulator|nr:LysR family transcriptional regulator [Pelagimonas sp.]